jgi:hypothetical protein
LGSYLGDSIVKNYVWLFAIITVIWLVATNSLYVEINELAMIVIFAAVVPGMIGQWLPREEGASIRALLSFIIYWALSLFDMVVDYVIDTLRVSSERVDGRKLTLGEAIQEYTDDLMVMSFLAPLAAVIIWFGFRAIPKAFRKRL